MGEEDGHGMQELEETIYWFELIVDAKLFTQDQMSDLSQEADELMAILAGIVKKEKLK